VRTLLLGIDEFLSTRRAAWQETFARLAHGQEPDTLAIACSDSRISPVEFASSAPGDVFVVRNVGNLVPPHTDANAPAVGAAIEYALAKLPIRDVVVCGHSACGAMAALLDGRGLPDAPHLSTWLAYGRREMAELPPAPPGLAPVDHLSRENVLRQLENLRSYPAVRSREGDGRLRLHAWWFEIGTASFFDFDPAARRYVPLDRERIARLLSETDGRRAGG
jgi:carbonic anhydrase